MTGDEWEVVKNAFEAALRQSECDRAAYLNASLGDSPSILKMVSRLLANYREEETLSNAVSAEGICHPQVFRPGNIVANRFRIIRFIASGGMGQIYEAYDQALGLSIALKVLHGALTSNSDMLQSFRQEIRIAREISHPNLCRIYDFVDYRTEKRVIPCFSMELLEGENLASYISAHRPMTPAVALPILRSIAEALDTLHQHGVIHRDLKPSNVVFSRNRVVITDFGLAKITDRSSEFSEPDIDLAGSPYYLSPELWSKFPASVASDIYAFGLVIDEMVTMSPAFDFESLPSLYFSKLREGPMPPCDRSTGLPLSWQRAILRCLHADPNERYETAAAVIADLTEKPFYLQSSAGLSHRRPTVAVMPFLDLSHHKGQSHLCTGIAEEVSYSLSQRNALRVIARNSILELDVNKISVIEIGRKLKANYLLQGNLTRSGKLLQITVYLIEASKGYSIWSERFSVLMDNLVQTQDEIVRLICACIDTESRYQKPRSSGVMESVTGEAYELYLQGLFHFHLQNPSAILRATELFEHSIKLDEHFAMTHAASADSYCCLEWYALESPEKAMSKARRAIAKALAINPELASALCTNGVIKARYERRWDEAVDCFQQAMELGPSLARAHLSYALDYLTPMGRLDEALNVIGAAIPLDPLSPLMRTAVGGCLYRKRMYNSAAENLKRALSYKPDFYHAHWSLARVFEQLGELDSAVSHYEAALLNGQELPLIIGELGHCFGIMHREQEAIQLLNRFAQSKTYVSPLCWAFIYLGFGQIDKAIDQLEAAVVERSGALNWLRVDPRFDRLSGNKRFQSINAALGLKEAIN